MVWACILSLVSSPFYNCLNGKQCCHWSVCPDQPVRKLNIINLSRLMTKPTKWHVSPAKTQISLGIRVFAVRMKKTWVHSYPLSTQRRLIKLSGCPGWSVSSLGKYSILSWGGSNHFTLTFCVSPGMQAVVLYNLARALWVSPPTTAINVLKFCNIRSFWKQKQKTLKSFKTYYIFKNNLWFLYNLARDL